MRRSIFRIPITVNRACPLTGSRAPGNPVQPFGAVGLFGEEPKRQTQLRRFAWKLQIRPDLCSSMDRSSHETAARGRTETRGEGKSTAVITSSGTDGTGFACAKSFQITTSLRAETITRTGTEHDGMEPVKDVICSVKHSTVLNVDAWERTRQDELHLSDHTGASRGNIRASWWELPDRNIGYDRPVFFH